MHATYNSSQLSIVVVFVARGSSSFHIPPDFIAIKPVHFQRKIIDFFFHMRFCILRSCMTHELITTFR